MSSDRALSRKTLDLILTEGVDVAPQPGPIVRHHVEHVALGRLEPDVVLEEVRVAEDVRHDELLLHLGIRAHQVGVDRVVVDDELVDLREPVAVALLQPLVLHPETPGGVAHWEAAVARDGVDVLGVQQLEDDRVEVEPRRRVRDLRCTRAC